LNLYAESTMRQEAEAFGTANRPDLFNMLEICTSETAVMAKFAEFPFHALG
jgi:hypothetical protein